MAKARHQLPQAGTGCHGERATHLPQIVKMQTRHASLRARSIPERTEVRPAQLGAVRPDKDQAPVPRLGEPFQMPAQFRHQLGGENVDEVTTRPG
jgi:hypothetical protein